MIVFSNYSSIIYYVGIYIYIQVPMLELFYSPAYRSHREKVEQNKIRFRAGFPKGARFPFILRSTNMQYTELEKIPCVIDFHYFDRNRKTTPAAEKRFFCHRVKHVQKSDVLRPRCGRY